VTIAVELVRREARLEAEGPIARGGMAFVRIVFGLMWVANVAWKRPPFEAFEHFTGFAVSHPVFAPWTFVVENVVLPNFTPFAWGVTALEVVIGAFLLVGFATRLTAAVGAVQTVAIGLSVIRGPNEWDWAYHMMFAGHVAIIATAAGRAFGVDGLLRASWLRSSHPIARILGRAS
jgi:thiosulfate dehydrogenase [quinone] large subunit